jgi:antitoxin component of MazEF toxin-antitoxin module
MVQKIIKVGNSYALTIPRELVKALNLTDANIVEVETDTDNGTMTVDFQPAEQLENTATIIDPEIYEVAKQLLKRYLPALKELSSK